MRRTRTRHRAALLLVWGLACGTSAGPGPDDSIPDIERERSLVWIDPAIVDDARVVGLARVMEATRDDHRGGRVLHDLMARFATTAHSERLGPALLLAEWTDAYGSDPDAWNLDLLPFVVTGVHNRIDLGPRQGECGELRVSFASTHPIYAPFHIIALFRQPAIEGDGPLDDRHCRETARRWAELSEGSHEDFVAAAERILDEILRPENFLMFETVELTVSPWEWRQWVDGDNPPLFQTVDVARLNQEGALRDDFLDFALDNAAGLEERTVVIPARFRAPSARVPPADERPSLDLAGAPDVARAIELIGCPGCHTHHAEFVHTSPQRTFSTFYDLELDARAAWLALRAAGDAPVPPFGPLQE